MSKTKKTVSATASTTKTIRWTPPTASNEVAILRLNITDQPSEITEYKKVEDAVFSYIRAKRILGEKTVNTAEIARSLRLPRKLVEAAANNMRSKGVRRK
jgi:hypothetical protein